jgi:hypothetical protein
MLDNNSIKIAASPKKNHFVCGRKLLITLLAAVTENEEENAHSSIREITTKEADDDHAN